MLELGTVLKRHVALAKGIDEAKLADWGGPELISLAATLSSRLIRGVYWRHRLGSCRGWMLAGPRVRILHARHVSAGERLSLEEGCEVVGLARKGVRFGNRCTVGRFASIRPTNVLLDEVGEGLLVGNNSNIGAYSYVGCSGFVEIGNNVMMGPRVTILAENHQFQRTDVPMKSQGVVRKAIHIEDDCWLGANCAILAGVRVGRGSIVATGAVVTKSVPEFTVVGGVPARVLRQRNAAGTVLRET